MIGTVSNVIVSHHYRPYRTSPRDRVEPGMRHAARSLRFTDAEFYFSIKEIGSFEQFCQIIESDTAKEEKSYSRF